MLARIFADDDVQKPPITVTKDSDLDGLSRSHTKLVEYVETKGAVNRAEFEAMVKSLGIFSPDAALEMINDWSFDHFHEPLLDDSGEQIVLVPHLRERLAKLREMSR
jgi:hypothetical protein